MYDRAAATLDLPIGLADQIRTCNSVYQVKFGVKTVANTKFFPVGVRCSEHRLPVKGKFGMRILPINRRWRRWRH